MFRIYQQQKNLKRSQLNILLRCCKNRSVQPDVLVLRTEHDISKDIRNKVALFCNVEPEAVMQSIDVPNIYRVPINMQNEKLDEVVLSKMGFNTSEGSSG